MNLKMTSLSILGLFLTTLAFAKTMPTTSANTVFVFLDDGGEHPAEKCESKTKAPKKLKKEKRLESASGYMGSIQTEFANKNEAGIDAWEHYFKSAGDCQATLTSQNSNQ